ncbi:MAG TPA: flagellar hook capping FlgD N-terminal domain-containing protein [Candidatus Angelobacter sp.]|nr:flagellar hook capping FlgD N-terminal domain-containing protein [Candidatus Angelobacter sp.]
MNVQAFASSAPTTNNNDQQSLSGLTGDSFLTLLTAQLKSQDPTQPTDPTEFVGQLVQFNSLEQLLQIKDLLQQSIGAPTDSTQSSTQVPQSSQAAQVPAAAL